MAGEELHERGRVGARRAKAWLEATTRANVHWVTPDRLAVPKLTFTWAGGRSKFSYDLAGVLMDGDLDSQLFLAESKFYTRPADQGSLYIEYLAKCYRAFATNPERCDNFMWITWTPFSIAKWHKLCSCDSVREATLRHCTKALGISNLEDAVQALDENICQEVAARLWLIVLSDRQESLVVAPEHHVAIHASRSIRTR